jgi:DNA-binding NarL/FixJ family response regulator
MEGERFGRDPEEAVAEPNPDGARRPLGTIWIDCPHHLLSGKLEGALRADATSIHRGPEPPRQLPSAVVCCAAAADVAARAGTILASCPGTPLLVLGPSADLSLARAALRAGARGFVHAGMHPGQIARALRLAVEGEVVLPRGLLEELVADDRRPDLSDLGPRQREVLELVAQGLSNAQIARRLWVSQSSVKRDLTRAYEALGVDNRRQAAGVLRRILRRNA